MPDGAFMAARFMAGIGMFPRGADIGAITGAPQAPAVMVGSGACGADSPFAGSP